MIFNFMFFFNSLLLGVGLAMDAFSVSLANGLNEPKMKKRRQCLIAGVFAFFQFIMPLAGFFCVHTVASFFSVFEKFIPFIALGLLGFIGGKMLVEGIRKKDEEDTPTALTIGALMLQGVATSIDALSVGFTIASHTLTEALVAVAIIAAVTFALCLVGVYLGKKFGTVFSNKATIVGGIILILIGIKVLTEHL